MMVLAEFAIPTSGRSISWPVFREHYQAWCARVLAGEELSVPAPAALEKQPAEPLDREAQLAELKKLREETGL